MVGVVRALFSDAARDPHIAELERNQYARRYDEARMTVQDAVDRTELPPDTDTHELVELIAVPIYCRFLVTHEPLDHAFADRAAGHRPDSPRRSVPYPVAGSAIKIHRRFGDSGVSAGWSGTAELLIEAVDQWHLIRRFVMSGIPVSRRFVRLSETRGWDSIPVMASAEVQSVAVVVVCPGTPRQRSAHE